MTASLQLGHAGGGKLGLHGGALGAEPPPRAGRPCCMLEVAGTRRHVHAAARSNFKSAPTQSGSRPGRTDPGNPAPLLPLVRQDSPPGRGKCARGRGSAPVPVPPALAGSAASRSRERQGPGATWRPPRGGITCGSAPRPGSSKVAGAGIVTPGVLMGPPLIPQGQESAFLPPQGSYRGRGARPPPCPLGWHPPSLLLVTPLLLPPDWFLPSCAPPSEPRPSFSSPAPPGVNLQKKQATNYTASGALRRDEGVCAMCWGDPLESEVRGRLEPAGQAPGGGEGGLQELCVTVLPPPPAQILVGCLDRSVKLFSTEKGKFTESRLCPGGEGPFRGLAVQDGYGVRASPFLLLARWGAVV